MKGAPRMRAVLEEAERLGYRVERTRNCHLWFRHPNGAQVFTPTTPSDHRATKNAMSALRRQYALSEQRPNREEPRRG